MTVTVTPSDPTLSEGTIAVQVGVPDRFGAVGGPLDADIIKTAHRTGVLSHFIRAHVAKKSGGDRMAYRYEPIARSLGDVTYISRDENMRVQQPFADYRLATQADALNPVALPAGALLIADDIHPRAPLLIACTEPSGPTPIGTASTANPLVTEIFDCNNNMNWASAAGAAAPGRISTMRASPFTAQTTLAASYGLMQVMYGLAIEMRWRADDGSQNPSKLFDPPGAVDRGEGSLLVGSRRVRNLLGGVMRRRSGWSLANRAELHVLFHAAWNGYNSGEAGYGLDIAGRLFAFQPVQDRPIIQP